MADRPKRGQEPQMTDLNERLVALKRRNAGPVRRERLLPQAQLPATEAVPSQLPSQLQVPPAPSLRSPKPATAAIHHRQSRTTAKGSAIPDADHDDFSRRLKISSPEPQPQPQTRKLFNPHQVDPVASPRRTLEPEALSDATSSSYLPLPLGPHGHSPPTRDRDAPHPRQLFDHRKDDPMRFSVLARPPRPTPTPKSSGDYISASSTSSYASSFTLSSTTDGSSTSSALFDRPGGGGAKSEESGTNAFALQLKKLYRAITNLETKVKAEDADSSADDNALRSAAGRREASRVALKGKQPEITPPSEEDAERERWKAQIANHKQLADYIHNLLQLSLASSVPATLRNIPQKYNIPIRLWTFAFHKLLESLRRASFQSRIAFEHLQEFIYYAYGFYTGLLEEPTLSLFKQGWLEALGDLARYRMAVSAMVYGGGGISGSLSGRKLTQKDVNEVVVDQDPDKPKKPTGSRSISDKPAARIDDSPSPSVGIVAARMLEVETEPELWRRIAKEWYGSGLAEQPGTGKLHHHLGLLSRESEGEELRGVYHFVKSMTTLHPFSTSRESVLPLWSTAGQTRRARSDTSTVKDLFVLLHGMLFTNIQLDDFPPTLARFIERLQLEDPEEREWLMMAIVNIASVFEYGRPGSVLGRLGGKEPIGPATIVITKPTGGDDEKMEVDEPKKSPIVLSAQTSGEDISPGVPQSENGFHVPTAAPASPEYPLSFKYALQLTFSMLSYVLKHPIRNPNPTPSTSPSLNPYLTVLLTFLATAFKNAPTLAALERSVPWQELASFFARIPRVAMTRQGLFSTPEKGYTGPRWTMITSGCAPPLPEDWCMRGMEWVGRSVFERGYWKGAEDRRAEIEVLDERDTGEITDGHIEDDDDENAGSGGGKSGGLPKSMDVMKKRWDRITRSAVGIAVVVDGFTWVEGTREWRVEGALGDKVKKWEEENRVEREMEEQRRMGTRWSDDSMDVDEEDGNELLSEEESDENDTDEVKALKARRRYLQSLLQSAHQPPSIPPSPHPHRMKVTKTDKQHPSLCILPGYTVLVVDTNIFLSSLSMVSSLIESRRWTIIVPLPVVMELEGLINASAQLGEAAQSAMTYLSSHVRTHTLSLKVQTSKGNYLKSLSIRTEQVDFSAGDGNWERNMDDLILKAAIWQEEHWIDRSAMLNIEIPKDVSGAMKVVLLSLDRNLRLKARSRQLCAANEKELAFILANAT